MKAIEQLIEKNGKGEGSLAGVDGNAYSLMGYTQGRLEAAGWSSEDIEEVLEEAMRRRLQQPDSSPGQDTGGELMLNSFGSNKFEVQFYLHDSMDECRSPKKVTIRVTGEQVLIRPEGYGDYCSEDENGWPIAYEVADGKPRIIVWPDINDEDETIVVQMEGALETNRKEDDDE